MAQDTIVPNENDREHARRLVELAQTDPERAQEILAHEVACARRNQNLVHKGVGQ